LPRDKALQREVLIAYKMNGREHRPVGGRFDFDQSHPSQADYSDRTRRIGSRGGNLSDGDTDYAVLDDETRIGRMYLEQMPAGAKWCRFLQVMVASPPNCGVADTLVEAKTALTIRYWRPCAGRGDYRPPESIVDIHPFSKQA
jgi:hypothetical protein